MNGLYALIDVCSFLLPLGDAVSYVPDNFYQLVTYPSSFLHGRLV